MESRRLRRRQPCGMDRPRLMAEFGAERTIGSAPCPRFRQSSRPRNRRKVPFRQQSFHDLGKDDRRRPGDRESRATALASDAMYEAAALTRSARRFRQRSRHGLCSIAPRLGIGPRRGRPDRWNASRAARRSFRNGASPPLRVTVGSAVALAASSSTSGVLAL
jgi:hypothetical protein